jgi:transcriptional regulator with XRE-family HTH domain
MKETIGNRIRKLRESILTGKKISQKEFAKTIGIDQTSLSRIEKGVNNPSPQTILLIELIYGVGKEWLQTGEGDIFKNGPNSEKILKFRRKDDVIKDERYRIASEILKDIFVAEDEGVIGAIYSNLLQFKRIPSKKEAPKKKATPGKSSGDHGNPLPVPTYKKGK